MKNSVNELGAADLYSMSQYLIVRVAYAFLRH